MEFLIGAGFTLSILIAVLFFISTHVGRRYDRIGFKLFYFNVPSILERIEGASDPTEFVYFKDEEGHNLITVRPSSISGSVLVDISSPHISEATKSVLKARFAAELTNQSETCLVLAKTDARLLIDLVLLSGEYEKERLRVRYKYG